MSLSRAKQRDSFSSLFSKGGLPGQIIGRQHDGRQTHQVHLDGAKVETLGFPPSCTTSNRTLPNTRNAELFSALALRNLTTTGLKGCNSKVAPFRHADEALLKASCNEFAAAETYPQRFGVCIMYLLEKSFTVPYLPQIAFKTGSHPFSRLVKSRTQGNRQLFRNTYQQPTRACDGLWSRFDQTAATRNPNEVGEVIVASQ